MAQTKTQWRRDLVAARRALPPNQRAAHAMTIAARVRAVPAFASCRSLLTYEPLGAEVDARTLASEVRLAPKAVFLPCWDAGEPTWVAWSASIATPRACRPEPPLCVLAPGVGFDPRGVRLGRGQGFYDRALARLRMDGGPVFVIGLGFEFQVVDALPCEAWDQPMDAIATELRLLTAEPGGSAEPRARAAEMGKP